MSQRVILRGNSEVVYKEGVVSVATLLPGQLVQETGSSQTTTSPSGQAFAPLYTTTIQPQALTGRVTALVALENFWAPNNALTPNISTAWPANATVQYAALQPGVEFLAWLAANATAVAFGDFLESDGAGNLREYTVANGDKAAVTINSGVSNGGINLVAVKGGAAGNSISIQILAAGTAAIAVNNGQDIVVTPQTGSTSATAIVAQIVANAAAAALVTATAVGTGAGLVGVIAQTLLAAGQDGGSGNAQFQALGATSQIAQAQQIRVRVLN